MKSDGIANKTTQEEMIQNKGNKNKTKNNEQCSCGTAQGIAGWEGAAWSQSRPPIEHLVSVREKGLKALEPQNPDDKDDISVTVAFIDLFTVPKDNLVHCEKFRK